MQDKGSKNTATRIISSSNGPGMAKDTAEASISWADIKAFAKFPPDKGRKLILDNIDIHQETHDMTEEYQNPDAHYCSLISTENRVSGNRVARPYWSAVAKHDAEGGQNVAKFFSRRKHIV